MKYGATNLDVVSLVIVAALAEETMVHYIMNIQLIQQRVTILYEWVSRRHSLARTIVSSEGSHQTHLGY